MKKTSCRLCKSTNLVEWLDLGFHPHSDQFRIYKDDPEEYYPLNVNQCQDCGFCQLGYTVDPKILYTKDYLYESSITTTGDNHWAEFVNKVTNKTQKLNGNVLDIGSNDGTLLSKFKNVGFDVYGVDPCPEIASIANAKGIPTIVNFFCREAIANLPKMDIITGSNVFAHIDDLDAVVENILYLLKDDGVFIFESPYLGNFISGKEYDTVYHQHLSILSLKPLRLFFAKYGLEIWDVDLSQIHGGSFRCYISRINRFHVQDIVNKIASEENFSLDVLLNFGQKVKEHRLDLRTLLNDLKKAGKSICAVSAPAKGMTLLNYTKIGDYLDFVTEKSKLKIGRYTPGSHIQIVDDSELIKRNPDYALLLAWNFAPEIMHNNKEYKGKWIVPLPQITIIP